jgi:hypothetical protein
MNEVSVVAASASSGKLAADEPLRSTESDNTVFIFLGNHTSPHGIGEILYSLYRCLGKKFSVVTSTRIRPDAINVIIDEFSNPNMAPALSRVKELHPRTKYIIVATEFLTEISLFGIELGRTFNFFGGVGDWKALTKSSVRRALRLKPGYMPSRYSGFLAALGLCDMLLVTHPAIADSLAAHGAGPSRRPPPLLLYPEIELDFPIKRLEKLRFGFTMSGTLTRYRKQCVHTLLKQLDDLHVPVYAYTPFSDSSQLVLSAGGVGFDRDFADSDYLFNLNPPQNAKWPYSSPMRILRAALLGQIPVITKRTDDHPIEGIATLWNPRTSAVALWELAEFNREALVNDYIKSVAKYNAIATGKSAQVLSALSTLLEG